jgi:hypothetical protein
MGGKSARCSPTFAEGFWWQNAIKKMREVPVLQGSL